MEISTHLGRDRFGWMTSELQRRDHVVMLARATAPLPSGLPLPPSERPRVRLLVVLDHSRSMGDGRLDLVRRALRRVVDRLGADDELGLVTFADDARVVVSLGRVTDRDAVLRRIDAVTPGGSTDIAYAVTAAVDAIEWWDDPDVDVLLVTDGHATTGQLGLEPLALWAHERTPDGTRLSTLAVGPDCDHELLDAMARFGRGTASEALDVDTAVDAIARIVPGLREPRFRDCRLTVVPAVGIRGVDVVSDEVVQPVPGGLRLDLGSFSPSASRTVILELAPHTATRPGRRKVAKLRLDYRLDDDPEPRHTATTVWTRVIRPGEPEGVVDRQVLGEWYVQRVLRRKRQAVASLVAGRPDEAARLLDEVVLLARETAPKVGRTHRDELLTEADDALRQRLLVPEPIRRTR